MTKERIFIHEVGRQGIKKRLLFVGLVLTLGFGIVLYRSYSLQVRPQQKLGRLAEQQYQKKVSNVVDRGSIYDRKGEEMAISVPSYSVGVHPRQVREPAKIAQQLQSQLKLPKRILSGLLNSPQKFVWLKRRLSPNEASILQNPPTDGLRLIKESQRFYPNRELASPLLGAVGYDNQGLSGLELYYDKVLKGTPVQEVAYRDARGEIFDSPKGDSPKGGAPNGVSPRAHLTLTLDQQIQFVTERELQATASRLKAKAGAAVIMDPTNGAILAMASYPSFNPNSYSSYDLSLWKNKAVSELFEPGSTFKTIGAAAALEYGVARLEDRFFCENGSLKIGKNIIHDHNPYGHLSFLEILKVSSNIGIYKVGQKVGRERFYTMIRDFGFGERTGIDFPGEIQGKISPPTTWSDIDMAAISFGQGIGVTGLQITNSFATIASGGLRWRPYLVQKIVDEHGKVLQNTTPQIVKRVLKEETAKNLTEVLKSVVSEEGTGKLALLPGYTIAGKTGTAQKLDPKTRRYSHTKFLSSFVGYLPAEAPRLVIFVAIDEPVGITYGGQVAAPIFKNIALAAVQHFGIPPDQAKAPIVTDSASPSSGKMELLNRSPVEEGSLATIPDLHGLSMREVVTLLGERGIKTEIHGTGFAVNQSLTPGKTVPRGTLCQITFQPNY